MIRFDMFLVALITVYWATITTDNLQYHMTRKLCTGLLRIGEDDIHGNDMLGVK